MASPWGSADEAVPGTTSGPAMCWAVTARPVGSGYRIGTPIRSPSDPQAQPRPRLPGATWTPTWDPPSSTGFSVPCPELIGQLSLAGAWWMPGVEAAYGAAHASDLVAALLGAPVQHEMVASDPWTARHADRGPVPRPPGVPRRRECAPEPAVGRPRIQRLCRAVPGQHHVEDHRGQEQDFRASPELLDSYEPERRGVVELTVASAKTNMRSLAGELPPDGPAIQLAKRPEFHSLAGARYRWIARGAADRASS